MWIQRRKECEIEGIRNDDNAINTNHRQYSCVCKRILVYGQVAEYDSIIWWKNLNMCLYILPPLHFFSYTWGRNKERKKESKEGRNKQTKKERKKEKTKHTYHVPSTLQCPAQRENTASAHCTNSLIRPRWNGDSFGFLLQYPNNRRPAIRCLPVPKLHCSCHTQTNKQTETHTQRERDRERERERATHIGTDTHNPKTRTVSTIKFSNQMSFWSSLHMCEPYELCHSKIRTHQTKDLRHGYREAKRSRVRAQPRHQRGVHHLVAKPTENRRLKSCNPAPPTRDTRFTVKENDRIRYMEITSQIQM